MHIIYQCQAARSTVELALEYLRDKSYRSCFHHLRIWLASESLRIGFETIDEVVLPLHVSYKLHRLLP